MDRRNFLTEQPSEDFSKSQQVQYNLKLSSELTGAGVETTCDSMSVQELSSSGDRWHFTRVSQAHLSLAHCGLFLRLNGCKMVNWLT